MAVADPPDQKVPAVIVIASFSGVKENTSMRYPTAPGALSASISPVHTLLDLWWVRKS